jgi:RNA 2',3'-cyclic 3'-phosphodiesterase
VLRAFIAVEIAAEIVNRIAAAIDQLRPQVRGIRWVAPANIHLTVKFLGNIDESQIEPICQALTQALRPFPRCTINAKGIGAFPSVKRPRVLWVGLHGRQLISLAEKVTSVLAPLGFMLEERTFIPHLTVGRWRQGERAERTLEQALSKWRDFEFGPSPLDEVILFQSVLKPAGAIYTRLNVFALGRDQVL